MIYIKLVLTQTGVNNLDKILTRYKYTSVLVKLLKQITVEGNRRILDTSISETDYEQLKRCLSHLFEVSFVLFKVDESTGELLPKCGTLKYVFTEVHKPKEQKYIVAFMTPLMLSDFKTAVAKSGITCDWSNKLLSRIPTKVGRNCLFKLKMDSPEDLLQFDMMLSSFKRHRFCIWYTTDANELSISNGTLKLPEGYDITKF